MIWQPPDERIGTLQETINYDNILTRAFSTTTVTAHSDSDRDADRDFDREGLKLNEA